MIAQIAEQIDYLRFMPPRTPENARKWWTAMIRAGPDWVVFGAVKQAIGLFLAWTNSYTRITRHYPGRLVFLGVNLAIALILMEANMFDFLNTILGFYANCGMAWVVVVASDIVFKSLVPSTRGPRITGRIPGRCPAVKAG